MDFVKGLPKSWDKSIILVVVDRLTKFALFIPLSYSYTTKSVATVFIENIYKLYGFPIVMVSDKDSVFTSEFWKEGTLGYAGFKTTF